MTRNHKSTIIFDPKAKTEKFKRPDHPDFHTTEEHKKNKFTGIRQNNIALQWEFWILGRVEKTVSFAIVATNKKALEEAHMELFGLWPADGTFTRR